MNLVLGGLGEAYLVVLGFGGAGAGTTAPQTFRQALHAKLASIADLSAIVGTHIYPGALPTTHNLDRDGPAVSYNLVSYIQARHLDRTIRGSSGVISARVQVDAWSYLQGQSDSIARALFAALEGISLDSTWGDGSVPIVSCTRGEEFDAPQLDLANKRWIYRIISEYEIKYRVAIPSGRGG